MKKKFVLLAMLLLVSGVLLISAVPTYAEEPAVGTAEDNACNPGGVMDGKCDTDWEWTCGYYLARWISAGGWGGNYMMNSDCVSLLPPVPVVEINEAGAVAGIDPAQVAAVIEICKNATGNRYCLYSNQTGTQDTGADGSIQIDLRFYPGGPTCPPAPPEDADGNPDNADLFTNSFTTRGFTTNELDNVLGLQPRFCNYLRP